jgi:hypothetical protein
MGVVQMVNQARNLKKKNNKIKFDSSDSIGRSAAKAQCDNRPAGFRAMAGSAVNISGWHKEYAVLWPKWPWMLGEECILRR